MENYDYAAIRKLIEDAFSEDEFQRFCFDYFREVRNKFTTGQTHGTRIIDLADYARRYGHVERLLEKIKEINPYQFDRYKSKITSGGFETSTSPTPPRQTPTGSNVKAGVVQGLIQAGQIGSVHVQHIHHSNGAANTGMPLTSDNQKSGRTKINQDRKSGPSPDSGKAIHILHLSDLHFGGDAQSDPLGDASRWCGQLIDDLCDELGCDHLHSVIISGDIGNFSEPEEYQAAEIFLERLGNKFGLNSSNLIIVPGNHDLNWKLSKKGYRLLDEEYYDGPLKKGDYIRVSDDVIRLRDDANYPKRFQNFGRFYENSTGVAYPLDPKIQATFHHLPELNLLFVGFNSSWEIDHHFKVRVSINPDAVEFALSQIRERADYKDSIKFAVWHHPLSSLGEDRIKDYGFMDRLAQAEFNFCLHGHIHKADADLFRYDMGVDDRRIDVIGAGTFGAPVKEWTQGYPLQYNLLCLSENILRVETRCRREINGTWGPDHLWRQGKGKSNLPYYDILLPVSLKTDQKSESSGDKQTTDLLIHTFNSVLEAQIRMYCEKAKSLYEKLPLMGFKTRLRVPILIKDIYIPLRVMVDRRVTGDACFADADDAEKCLREFGCEEISIPEAFRVAEGLRRRGIVVLGDPGSGKTTHLKRVFLWCLEGGLEQLGLPPGMIPVFLPLRELKNLETDLDNFIQEQLNLPQLGTPEDFGKALLERGNLLFLLDGLDEVSDTKERVKVSRWIDAALRVHKTCWFIVTCRFAGYTPKARLNEDFLEMHMRPLTTSQAEDFIRNWYMLVETGNSTDQDQAQHTAKKQAEDLIDRLERKEYRSMRVFTMTRNPLLLTNLCLVHRDRGGQLPTRRARLYEECIQVLLELWRESIEFKIKVDSEKGFQVLQPAAYWLHQKKNRVRATADELAPVIEPALKRVGWSHGSAKDFMRIVRDESGLLTGWSDDKYGFMHLGFQEYLAALEIQNLAYRDSKVLKRLAKNFGDSWWQEVILLLLAQKNPCLFKEFMSEVVKYNSFTTESNLMEFCLEESSETTVQPFLDLLKIEPGKDQNLWKRQLVALRILERLDETAINNLISNLKEHPFDQIRNRLSSRKTEEQQEVMFSEPGGYELVRIPGGVFMMGTREEDIPKLIEIFGGKEEWYKRETPQHEVQVPEFYMGRYPVTNEEYGRFLSENKDMKEPRNWGDRKYNQPKQPMVGVSWHDAKSYAKWAGLSLPSEAQWEYACRAGTATEFYTGDRKPDLDRAGWYEKNSGGQLHPVGEKEPNAFGLYDMHGNIFEWCEDDFHESYEGSPGDGMPRVDSPRGALRVIRGGSWSFNAGDCRSAIRLRDEPEFRYSFLGFRLLCLPGQHGEPGR